MPTPPAHPVPPGATQTEPANSSHGLRSFNSAESKRKPQHNPRQQTQYPFSNRALSNPSFGYRYGWLLGTLACVGWFAYWLSPILTPFLLGAILAYITNPVVNWLEKRHVPRTISAVFVLIALGLLITLFTLILLPLLQKEATALFERLPLLATRLNEQLIPWLNNHLGTHFQLDAATVRSLAIEHSTEIQNLAKSLFSSLGSGGAVLLTFFATLFLMPVVMFFQLRDGPQFVQRLDHLIPRAWHNKTRTIMQEIDIVLAEFLRGQISVMVALAAYYSLGLWLVGLEYAVPIGLATGSLIFIPYLGYGLGLILALSAGLVDFSSWNTLLFIAGVYFVGQILESFLLTPWLVGERIGLHPLAVIFALLAFGQIFGFVGILFALPASAALLVTLRHLKKSYLQSAFFRGRA